MKSKLIGILLLVCLALPIAFTAVFLHREKKLVRKQIKHQIIAGINRSALVHLKYTELEAKQQLRWKHRKEFSWNHQMYDVVEQQITNDTIHYWCWPDAKETRLNQKLQQLLVFAMQKDAKSHKSQSHLQHFLKSLYYSKSSIELENSPQRKLLFSIYQNNYQYLSFKEIAPPPQA